MSELHPIYHDLRDQAARDVAEGSPAVRAAGALLLSGVGFSSNYLRFNRASTLILPTEIDETTGMMPLVGLDLSRSVDLGRLREQDRTASLVPAGLEAVPVADWYVADRYLMPGSAQDILLGGYSREEDVIIGETIFHTDPTNIFSATKVAMETGLVDAETVVASRR